MELPPRDISVWGSGRAYLMNAATKTAIIVSPTKVVAPKLNGSAVALMNIVQLPIGLIFREPLDHASN